MKHKLALLLVVVLSISLLVGCGGGSQDEASGGDSQEKSSSADNSSVSKTTSNTVKKSNTFSGYLSSEDTIVYKVAAMDKAKTPETVYFFKNGKVTIIPGSVVGLTLGELSNMTDDEIWASYETYKAKYNEECRLSQENVFEEELKLLRWYLETIDLVLNIINGNVENISPENTSILREVLGIDTSAIGVEFEYAKNMYTDGYTTEQIAKYVILSYGYTTDIFYNSLALLSESEKIIAEEDLAQFVNMYGCSPYDFFIGNAERFTMGEDTGALIKEALAQYRTMVESKVSALNDSYKYISPLYEMPFTCIVETDATGNIVKTEEIVVPYWEAGALWVDTNFSPSNTVSAIKVTNQAEGGEVKIYDTKYNCFPLHASSYILCTRAPMRIDGVDSKGVLVDPSSEKRSNLYKDITLSRFE